MRGTLSDKGTKGNVSMRGPREVSSDLLSKNLKKIYIRNLHLQKGRNDSQV